jgi:hypothetical protein
MGLLTFAALATVALIIGLALAKPPAQQQASLAPDPPAPAPTAPPVDAAPDAAPPEDAAPDPAPAPHEDAAPDPPEDAAPDPAPAPSDDSAPTPQAQEPAPPAEPEQPPAEDTTPVSTPEPDVNGAAEYVRAFYADLEQRRYQEAWPRLAEDLRRIHGSFDSWVSGFDSTVRQSASDLVAKAAGPATVRVSLTLTAVDRDKRDCEATRRFAVEWRLDWMGGKWRALHAEGKEIKSPPVGVAASCTAQQPAQVAQNED